MEDVGLERKGSVLVEELLNDMAFLEELSNSSFDANSHSVADDDKDASARGESGTEVSNSKIQTEEEEDEDESDRRRRARVAARSRAARDRRKRERLLLEEKIKALEEENEGHKRTIAQLQNEAQMLRDIGQVDLRLENELLRAEVLEHRKFVQMFKRFKAAVPEQGERVKRLRLLNQGITSAINSCISFLSMSAVDPTWQLAQLNPTDPNESDLIKVAYQLLPHGSTVKNAKRLNMRVDSKPIDMAHSLQDISDALFYFYSGGIDGNQFSQVFADVLKHVNEWLGCTFDLKSKEVSTETLTRDGKETEETTTMESDVARTYKYELTFKFQEPGEEGDLEQVTNEGLVLAGYRKNVKLSSRFFPFLDDDMGMIDSNIIAMTTSVAMKDIEDLTECSNVGTLMVKGTVICRTPDDRVFFSNLLSTPIEETGFLGSRPSDVMKMFDGPVRLSRMHTDNLLNMTKILQHTVPEFI